MKVLLKEYYDNPEAGDIIRLIHYTKDSVFLTGKAGTGKSTLLRNLIKHIHKNYIILAPTGIAALNVDGQTLHSFFQFEPRPYLPFDKDFTILSKKEELLKNLDLIIIDEISMVRSDLMNAVDLTLRKNLKSTLPFAGKQILLIGDLFQLPPVVDNRKTDEVEILNSNYKTPYFFSAKVFEAGLQYHIIELEKVYRQKDKDFIELLNGVRENNLELKHLMQLNQRYNPSYSPDGKEFEIILATTNEIVRQTNQQELQKLSGKNHQFIAAVSGVFLKETNESRLPADKVLQLRENSQVMFVKNDLEKRWVNGSLGKIISLNENYFKVKLDTNNQTYDVQRVTWESYEYVWNKEEERIEKKINGTFTQFPLKLAWAVTIHKSQGQSFDKIIIDLGYGAFATGQTYVALSRCRSFGGITLKSKIHGKDIKVDERIKEFLNSKNQKVMEREKFESIIKGMQDKLNQLEPLNIELTKKVKEVDLNLRQLHQKVSEITTENNAKDSKISFLTKENTNFKTELSNLKSNTATQRFFLFVLIVLCLFLAYKLLVDK
jgi:ATP-dependent DNA helicase PIF1